MLQRNIGRRLATSLGLFWCLALADDQIIVYEAGASDWATQGSITTRPLADLSCPPGATFPGTAGLPNPEVFLLTSSSGRLDLRFNGTGISVFGITFSSSTCDAGDDAVVAFLDESSPGSVSGGGPGDAEPPVCSAFPTPRPVCGVLLARYRGLNPGDDHHLFLSTSGAQLGVLNAQVVLDGEPPWGPAAVAPQPVPTRRRTPVAVILPAVLVPVCLLSFIAGLFLVIRRRRQRASTSHIKPLPFLPTSPPRLAKSARSLPPAAKQLPGNTPASAAPQDADVLQRAIAAAGITSHELVVSLNRLGEQARMESPVASGQAPPRYEG